MIRGEMGHDTVDELYPLPGEPVVDKPGRGAFAHTDFDLLLRNKGVKNLVIAGVTTDVCVSTTMREANDRGYDCVVLDDGTAASEPSLHIGTMESIKLVGVIFGAIAKIDDVLAIMAEHKSLDFVMAKAKAEAQKAVDALSVLPESEYKQALISLAYLSVDRAY